MGTHNVSNTIGTHVGLLLCQVCQTRPFRTSTGSPQRTLQHDNRLECFPLPCHPAPLGLYTKYTVKFYMPGYVEASLHKFQHPWLSHLEDSPYKHNIPQYGSKVQLMDPINNSPPLSHDSHKLIQQVVGTFLYYAHAVDPTTLTALSDITPQQSQATANTASALAKSLNYSASHPNAIIMYQAFDMILKIHSDSLYLNALGTWSCIGGHHYLGNDTIKKPQGNNGPLLNSRHPQNGHFLHCKRGVWWVIHQYQGSLHSLNHPH